jgi:RNA polymerase sigma factor (sigma-70 family)
LTNKISTAILAAEAANDVGDMSAVERLYRDHSSWLVRTIRKRFGSDWAEDLAQETYLRAAAYEGREVRNPRGLLIQIATRAAIDRARRDHVRPPFAGKSSDEVHSPADQIEALALKQIILRMPPKLNEVFLLSRYGGLTNEDIGRRLGISVKTVESRMTKALRHCEKELQR